MERKSMKMSVKFGGAVAAAALVVSLGAAGVYAQDKAAIVKDRQETMKAQAAGLGEVKKYVEGNGDQKAAEAGVQKTLAALKSAPSKFQPGTSLEDMPNVSWAKPDIWKDQAKFEAAYKNAVAEVEKLDQAVKTGDKAKVQAQFADTGKNGCGGCHTPFRQAKPS